MSPETSLPGYVIDVIDVTTVSIGLYTPNHPPTIPHTQRFLRS